VGALSLQGGRAQIDEGGCKGCGRCVALCPDEVITVRVEDEERTLAQLVARIEARTEIGLARSGA
jgi:Fe-S-cluster-containing hydrogenase component 2